METDCYVTAQEFPVLVEPGGYLSQDCLVRDGRRCKHNTAVALGVALLFLPFPLLAWPPKLNVLVLQVDIAMALLLHPNQ